MRPGELPPESTSWCFQGLWRFWAFYVCKKRLIICHFSNSWKGDVGLFAQTLWHISPNGVIRQYEKSFTFLPYESLVVRSSYCEPLAFQSFEFLKRLVLDLCTLATQMVKILQMNEIGISYNPLYYIHCSLESILKLTIVYNNTNGNFEQITYSLGTIFSSGAVDGW